MKNKTYILIAILFLAIGFATVTTILYINGSSTIAGNTADFDDGVIFTNVKSYNGNASIDTGSKSINYETSTLSSIGDESSVEFTITNYSLYYDANISVKLEYTSSESGINYDDYIEYKFDKTTYNIATGNYDTGKLTIRLNKAPYKEMSISIKVTFTAEAKEIEKDDVVLKEHGCYISNTVTDSNPGEFNGSGTKSDPYLIESIEDLVALSLHTNDGTLSDGLYYKQTKDLDFNCDNSYVDTNNKTLFGDYNGDSETKTIKEELTESNGFVPIGNNNKINDSTYSKFTSTFDGDNHTIYHLYENVSSGYGGLFGYVGTYCSSGDCINAYIKNLNLKDANVTASSYTGILVGYVNGYTNTSTTIPTFNSYIENINVSGTVKGSYTGGVAGMIYSGSLKNATSNNLNISSNSSYSCIGGIVGNVDSGYFENLSNYSDIKTNGNNLGGVFGSLRASYVYNIYNYGNIESTIENQYGITGGVIGNSNCDTYVYNAGNAGKSVKGYGYIGGVLGHDGCTATYENLYNYADVYALSDKVSYIGGLAGYSDTVKYGYNFGDVYAKNGISSFNYIGAISGYSYKNNSYLYNVNSIEIDDSINNNLRFGGLEGSTIQTTENVYLKYTANIKSTSKNIYLFNPYINTLADNVYIDSTFGGNGYNLSVLDGYASAIKNVYYKLSGPMKLNSIKGTEYAFDNVNSSWFKDTLKLGDHFKFEDGYYPLLYKVDTSGNVTSELMDGQVKKAIE